MVSTSEDPRVAAYWKRILTQGPGMPRIARRLLAHLPRNPRCKFCSSPLQGIGGIITRPLTHGPSRKNPNLCRHCYELQPPGGAEVDIAVLFADVRGSTMMGERLNPRDFAALLNRFYATAARVLLAHDAVIDKLVGDEVMALFIPGFSGARYRERAVSAAEALLQGVGYGRPEEPWLPLGVGVHAGLAYVGNVGSEGIVDFTALGDTINTAARLQGQAQSGEIVLSDVVYQNVNQRYPDAEYRTLQLKGKEGLFPVRVVHLATMSGAR